MFNRKCLASAMTAGVLLYGSIAQAMLPSVQIMPAPNKPFEVFQQDQMVCQQYAEQSVGGRQQDVGGRAVVSGLAGTLLGAGLGAAIGGGRGAAIGAAGGMVAGTATGAGAGQQDAWEMQRQYDYSYSQCMYSRGNQVPGYAPAPGAPPPPPPYYSR